MMNIFIANKRLYFRSCPVRIMFEPGEISTQRSHVLQQLNETLAFSFLHESLTNCQLVPLNLVMIYFVNLFY